MKMPKIMVACAIFFIILLNSFPLNADYYGDEKKTTFGFRFGDYSFSDITNDDYYGDGATAISMDLTFPGNNPNISWRIALDGVASSADTYVNSNNYVLSDLAIGGFSGAVIFHNDRKEKFSVYGGFGLGFYNVTEDGSMVIGGIPIIISGEGSGMGLNLFGGINVSLADSFSLGIEYFIKNLKVDMMDSSGDISSDLDYGGQSLLVSLICSW